MYFREKNATKRLGKCFMLLPLQNARKKKMLGRYRLLLLDKHVCGSGRARKRGLSMKLEW